MNNYDGYTESAERTAARKARITENYKRHLAEADNIVTELNSLEPLCICLQYIGDNGDCPVHGKGFEAEGSDTSMAAQLSDAGFGSLGVM